MTCLEPVLLAGYLVMADPHRDRRAANLSGAMVSAQTCADGPGVSVRATQSGLGNLSAQYGWSIQRGPWSWSVVPHVGLAYVAEDVWEQARRTNFGLGVQVMGGYRRFRMAVEWWHVSNAGMGSPNAGLDMLAVLTGWAW